MGFAPSLIAVLDAPDLGDERKFLAKAKDRLLDEMPGQHRNGESQWQADEI
jgi:hypothetical protein